MSRLPDLSQLLLLDALSPAPRRVRMALLEKQPELSRRQIDVPWGKPPVSLSGLESGRADAGFAVG